MSFAKWITTDGTPANKRVLLDHTLNQASLQKSSPRPSQTVLSNPAFAWIEPPDRIQRAAIAHLQGNETVESRACFIGGRPFKQEYRRYRVKSFTNLPGRRANDDFQSMRDVTSR
ncbi:MAG: hypothetical protein CMJ35_12380 [Phycisphaerae bacterium]|nr:hypothetical protein [Phycisphaerae bacterium]MBM92392.1 hypothetical protein [Phycisphaerae bacterium]